MSYPTIPDTFRDHNGNHDLASLTNAGSYEANRGLPLTPQQHNETSREYELRQQAYTYEQRNNGY